MELFLHCSGLRVYSSKEQGASCKTTSADRYAGLFDFGPIRSGPLICDRTDRIEGDAGAVALSRRSQFPRWRCAGARRRLAFPVFQGSKWSGLGSGTLLTPCVIHWGSKRGSTGHVALRSRTAALLYGGASPAQGVRPCQGRSTIAKGARRSHACAQS